MKEYAGTAYQGRTDEVRALVRAAGEQGEQLYTVLNDVGLIVDSRLIDPDYEAQMIWTFEAIFAQRQDGYEVIPDRFFFPNLVPEMQAQAIELKRQYPVFGSSYELSQVLLLIKFVPVTWCKWAWSDSDDLQLAQLLAASEFRHNDLLISAASTLRGHRSIPAGWAQDAHTWLMTTN